MEFYWPVVSFLLGAIIGSFLNVVIYRLHTGKSLNDRSHCLSCGRTLHWYDLFPLVSYMVLRGRCRRCGAYIPYRYFAVELVTACAFLGVAYVTSDPVHIALLFVFVSILVVGGVYDLYHYIIPDEIVIWATVVGLGIVGYNAYRMESIETLFWSLGASAIAFLSFAGLWFVSGGRWIGFGDAKLAVPLALLVGVPGVFSFIVLSFWVGAAVSVAVMGLQALYVWHRYAASPTLAAYSSSVVAKNHRYLKMKSEIPFAPFLIGAFVLVYFFHADVLAITTYLLF